ncbi:hypothetical protein CBR_g30903 [Chara braunii]|uniref:Sugar phosphate transporter domain-containing protein n=1 Tax=Chara braunii TaxID=69332 RepID=A0A388LDQ6_CHABU|nr:hypothetical protein CBR_g30903 [Chara braunii]|eukprot:GBG80439.1 hypothetical protein CBR_g30903 [Chara braunii]
MAFCSTLAFLIVRVFKWVDSIGMSREAYTTSVVPIGALYALSLWFSNSAYIYLSVSFIQMLKALMPVAVYSIGVAMGKEGFSWEVMLNMTTVSVGVAIAATGELTLVVIGLVVQLCAIACEATRLVLVEFLLTKKGYSMNPITTLYYVAPCSFVFVFVPWFFIEFPKLWHMPSWSPDYFIFTTNAAVAFALNLAVFLLIGKTSALTMNIAGVVKDWMLIYFSWTQFHDPVTRVNIFGYGIAFLGVCYYNRLKFKKMKEKEEANSKSETTGSTADEERGLLLGSGSSAKEEEMIANHQANSAEEAARPQK